jgi:hypothetical protein
MFYLLKKFVKYGIALIGILAVAFYFRGYFVDHFSAIADFGENIDQHIADLTAPKPCSAPIVYSLGTFDTRFGLTRAQFLSDVNAAAQIWEKPLGKTFFQLASTTASGASSNDLKINLIYDYRQQATDAMNTIGSSIDDQTTVYSALKAKYTSLDATFTNDKAALATLTSEFKTIQAAYNQEVDYANSHGGASPDEYAKLTQEKNTLEGDQASISADQDSVNAEVDEINSTAATINKYVALLNSEATQYNSIGSSTGEEFDEGEYVEDSSGNRIDIFQYSSQDKLIRVLAHEFGHSLGLGHIPNNPQAIMYPLNQGTNLSLTADDIAALKVVCMIQ